MNYVIYGIFKKGDDRPFYIGQTFRFQARYDEHFREAKNGNETLVYRFMRKYECEIRHLASCFSIETLNASETDLINQWETFKDLGKGGANLSTGGDSYERSQDTKDKIALTKIGKPRPPEVIQALTEGRRNKTFSEEERLSASDRMKERWEDPVQREKFINQNVGRKWDEESKSKRLESWKKTVTSNEYVNPRKGAKLSDETKKKMSLAKMGNASRTGEKWSEEKKKRHSERLKLYHANKRLQNNQG